MEEAILWNKMALIVETIAMEMIENDSENFCGSSDIISSLRLYRNEQRLESIKKRNNRLKALLKDTKYA